jgi:hypothetical protein
MTALRERTVTERTIREASIAVCTACAAGYHEDIVFAAACCDCPCHGSQTPCASDKARADACGHVNLNGRCLGHPSFSVFP